MAQPRIELTIMAAEGLKNVSFLRSKMSPYAVAFVDPFSKHSTRVLRRAGTDPIWNDSLLIPLHDRFLLDPHSSLTIQVLNQSSINTSLVASTQLLLHDLLRHKALKGNGEADILTLQLYRPSGRPHGIIRVFLKLVGDSLPAFFEGDFDHCSDAPATGIPVMSMQRCSAGPYTAATAEKYAQSYPASYVHPAYLPYPTRPSQCARRNNNFLFGLVSGAIAAVLLGAIF